MVRRWRFETSPSVLPPVWVCGVFQPLAVGTAHNSFRRLRPEKVRSGEAAKKG